MPLSLLVSEDKLQLVTNHSPSTIGECCVGSEEKPPSRTSGVSRNKVGTLWIAGRRERTNAARSELRVIEDVVELTAEFYARGLRNPDPLHNVDIKVVGSRRTLGIATKSANARNTRFKRVTRNESWICDELSGVRINWRVVGRC